MSNFSLVRNAHVEVRGLVNDKKSHVAQIIVNGEHEHTFSPKSRVSKHLDMMTPKELGERLSGGSYFFVEDKLVDFRDGAYSGFVHTDQSIGKFMDVLGYQERQALGALHRRKRFNDDGIDVGGGDIVLRKIWSDHGIEVPGYKAGGDFSSQLSFVWNPFVQTINSSYDLIRLICTNGMVGVTSFLNSRIPLVNRWEEHLDIASRQIQNKVSAVVVERIQAMAHERATVADCLLLESHAFDRLHGNTQLTEGARDNMLRLMAAVAPKAHLRHAYRDGVFDDKTLAAQLPSHLSAFDAYNIATELRTHTDAAKGSSDAALDKFANGLLFDGSNYSTHSASRFTAPKLSAFSDPEQAFFSRVS